MYTLRRWNFLLLVEKGIGALGFEHSLVPVPREIGAFKFEYFPNRPLDPCHVSEENEPADLVHKRPCQDIYPTTVLKGGTLACRSKSNIESNCSEAFTNPSALGPVILRSRLRRWYQYSLPQDRVRQEFLRPCLLSPWGSRLEGSHH